MKRLLLLLAALPAFAQLDNVVMELSQLATSSTSLAMSSNLYQAFRFPASGKSVSSVTAYVYTVTGTVNKANFTAQLRASEWTGSGTSSYAQPSSTVTEEVALAASGNVAAATEYTWTFAGTSSFASSGGYYWVVLKNGQGTPASNYPTLRIVASVDYLLGRNIVVLNSADNSSWASAVTGTTGVTVCYTDGTCVGSPAYSLQTHRIYTGSPYGFTFTIPSGWPTVNLKKIGFWAQALAGTWSDVGTLTITVYNSGGTSLGSVARDVRWIQTASWIQWPLDTAIPLSAGSTYRVLITASGGTSSNYVNTMGLTSFTTTATLAARMLATKSYNGTSDVTGEMFPFVLVLDKAGEFTTTGGGGTRSYATAY